LNRSNTAIRMLTLSGLLMGVTAVNALAVPMCTSAPNLAALITDGSCQYLDKIFTNFAIDFSGGHTSGSVATPTVPPANTVSANFSNSGTFTNGIPSSVTLTFSFTANNSIADYQTLDLQIQYQVDIAPGDNANMTGISGSTVAALSSSGTGNTIRATKDSCAGAGYEYGGLGSAPTEACDIPPALEDDPVYTATSWTKGSGLTLHDTRGGSTSFSLPVTTVGAYDEIRLNGGTGTVSGTPTAGIFAVANTFDEQYVPPVPEPGTLGLIGGALIGLSVFLRRKSLV
jgi:hypothetical protein